MEDSHIFFRPYRWINFPFTRVRVLSEGVVAMVEKKAEDGYIPVGAVVGGEVFSGGVRFHCHIGPGRRSGGDAVVCFCMPAQTKGTEYFVVGGELICRW